MGTICSRSEVSILISQSFQILRFHNFHEMAKVYDDAEYVHKQQRRRWWAKRTDNQKWTSEQNGVRSKEGTKSDFTILMTVSLAQLLRLALLFLSTLYCS